MKVINAAELDRFQRAHAELPHLRFGQLIVNAMQDSRGSGRLNSADTVQALFYAENDELLRFVEAYVGRRDGL